MQQVRGISGVAGGVTTFGNGDLSQSTPTRHSRMSAPDSSRARLQWNATKGIHYTYPQAAINFVGIHPGSILNRQGGSILNRRRHTWSKGSMNDKLLFLRHVLGAYASRQPATCPYCDASESTLVGTRRLIMQLRRCGNCGLMFRYPKDTPEFNADYYQSEYHEGMTTAYPDLPTLDAWKKVDFRGTPMDYSEKVSLVRAVKPEGRLLDFGASSGYVTLQFQRAGFDALGFELSRPRARYAREHVGVNVLEDFAALDNLAGTFDIVFSSHVIEHIPTPRAVFDRFRRMLKPGGTLISFVPNCGGADARKLGAQWGPMMGMRHCLSIDKPFIQYALPRHGLSSLWFDSPPYDIPSISKRSSKCDGQTDPAGHELLFCATAT